VYYHQYGNVTYIGADEMTKQAAQQIRQELKKEFPGVTFSVRTQNYNVVRIEYTNGPTEEDVKNIVNKYEYGHFDGMDDCYKYDNHRDDIEQTKYVFVQRNIPEEIQQSLYEQMRMKWTALMDTTSIDQFVPELGTGTPRRFVREFLAKMNLTNGLPEVA